MDRRRPNDCRVVGGQFGSLLELEAGNRIAVGVGYALSHGTNRVKREKPIKSYYSMHYAVFSGVTCGFRSFLKDGLQNPH
jgi:hypothetical protein